MNIALVQTSLFWEDPLLNRQNIEDKLSKISLGIDLVILPEMFSTGFTMSPERVAETIDGDTVAWLKASAQKFNTSICGSLVIKEDGRFFNRFVCAFPDGQIFTYIKRHLFSMAGEDKAYTKGHERVVFEYKGWRIAPFICYDLRFPVFSRNIGDYDLAIYVANWPAPRIAAWDALLKARAIENVAYSIGVNRVGEDANAHYYPGHSQVFDPFGNRIAYSASEDSVSIVEIDLEVVKQARVKFPFLDDRDEFTVM